jgi:hypothetical protein
MHASLTIGADDDLGRERLCRYGLRPPFSLSRFRVLRDGRISYRVKKSSRRVSRCRIMTPVECVARLCALVPPPRYPLTRFHGVLAPRAKAASSCRAHDTGGYGRCVPLVVVSEQAHGRAPRAAWRVSTPS